MHPNRPGQRNSIIIIFLIPRKNEGGEKIKKK